MKNFQKIWLGIAALAVFLPSLFLVVPSALATGNCGNQSPCLDQSFWDSATYSMPSQDFINVSNGPTRIVFQKAVGNIYDTSPLGGPPPNGLCGTYNENSITLASPDFSKPTLTGSLSVLYTVTTTTQQGQNQTNCSNSYKKSGLSITNQAVNQSGSCTFKACSNSDITGSLNSFKLAADAASVTGTFNGKTVTFTGGDTSDPNHIYSAPISTFCSGGGNLGSVTINDSDYQKILSTKENPVPGVLDVDWFNASNKSCNNYSPGNTAAISIDTSAYIASVSPGAPCTPPGATQGNLICGGSGNSLCTSQGCVWGTAPDPSKSTSCEANYSHPFTWILCPAMGLADDAAGQFNSFVDQQLCFSTGSTSSTGGVVCNGNNNLTSGVKNAWSIFKNLASALLVIVMLIMVISQAVGGGPFDAYTVRKMLPKLVAAVIIMQFSWVMLKWAIDLTNDVGTAINSLMLAPFGGTGHITLRNLVGFDLSSQSSVTSSVAATFLFFGALAGAAIVSVPGLAMMALYVVLALLTAFVVLLLRKMILIMLIILAPLALVLWVLPGTNRYWKSWSSDLTKLLFMFPMIEALIAAGKIFAYIASGASAGSIFKPHLAFAHLGPLPVPYFGTFTNFVQLIIIIGAWFAPYFLLPQTYKWGGAALGAMSKGVSTGVEKLGHPANEYLKWRQGLSPWKQARAARRAKQEIRAKTNFYEGLGAEGPIGQIRRARLRGVFRPTRRGYQEERSLTDSIVRGGAQRAEEEALKEAQAALEFELATDPRALEDHDAYVIDIARAGVGENVHGRVRNEADWRAAVEKMITYGGPNNRVFEELHHQYLGMGGEDRARWEKILNAMAPQVLSKFPFMYKDRDYSVRLDLEHASTPRTELGDLSTTISQLSADSFTRDAGIEGEAVETIMGHLSTLIREGDIRANPAATREQRDIGARARQQVTTMYSLFNQAITSESTRTRINPAAARAMKAAIGLNPTGLGDINRGRSGRGDGVPEIDSSVIGHTVITSGDPDMPVAVRNIRDRVRDDGNLSP